MELIEYFYALTPAVKNNLREAGLGPVQIVGFSSSCPEVASFSGYVPIIIANPSNPEYKKIIGYIAQQVFSLSLYFYFFWILAIYIILSF